MDLDIVGRVRGIVAEARQPKARLLDTVLGWWDAVEAVNQLPGTLLTEAVEGVAAKVAPHLPSMPAATLFSPHVGLPHYHKQTLGGPPLPSLGVVSLGGACRVLINGLPAARCGDIGLAPTCGGLSPFFEIRMGSSSVFLQGARAARMLDPTAACQAPDEKPSSLSAALVSLLKADIKATIRKGEGLLDSVKAIATVEQSSEDRIQAAKVAGMGAVQDGADLAKEVVKRTLMGLDTALTPSVGVLMMGSPTVMIGGIPMRNIELKVTDILRFGLGKVRKLWRIYRLFGGLGALGGGSATAVAGGGVAVARGGDQVVVEASPDDRGLAGMRAGRAAGVESTVGGGPAGSAAPAREAARRGRLKPDRSDAGATPFRWGGAMARETEGELEE